MEPLTYLSRYRVVVCKTCGFACVAKEVISHLQVRHRDIVPSDRRKIAEEVGRIPNIIRSQPQLVEFRFPPPTADPIPFLSPPHNDGLRCRQCPYVGRQRQRIQAHCHQNHNWQNPGNRGRPSKDSLRLESELPWQSGVQCQRFFPSRAASNWFEVGLKATTHKPPKDPSMPSSSTLAATTLSLLQSLARCVYTLIKC
ncbi:hypothetical protein BGZ63DRAFT_396922 [Mariannaea sp. PMI_226]|nr:hypothetical protein BGZ63DRAFT_396922 [Mariannaea sp. PMI_226]